MLFSFDRYTLDEATAELRRDTELVSIERPQLELLLLFLRNPNTLLRPRQIEDALWKGAAVADNVLSASSAKLRKLLGKTRHDGHFIENRNGRGYRFSVEVTALGPGESQLELAAEAEIDGPAASLQHARSQLVGRGEELLLLGAAAASALAGRGRLVLLRGEPGIGKTRLAEAFELEVAARSSQASAHSRQPFLTLWVRCQPEANVPLGSVRLVLQELARHGLVDTLTDALAEQAVEVAQDAPARAGSARIFNALGSDARFDHSVLDALAHQVVCASRRRPLLIIVDDIHWADSASVRVLAYIADEIIRSPLLLLCGMRHGGRAFDADSLAGDPAQPHDQAREPRELARLWNHRNCQHLELSRLKAHDVSAYVQARFGAACEGADIAELSRAVFARSEGNPFFMVDLVRTQGDPRALQPSSIALDVVRERLASLPASAREVLDAAAVLGHDFDTSLLSHVLGARPEQVLDVLSGPDNREALVHPMHKALAAVSGTFSFDHELIRELLYNELPAQQRAQLHWRAAQGLLRRLANAGEVNHAELAHHFLAAQPCGDVEVAVEYAQAAAADAFRLAAHADACEVLQRALEAVQRHASPRPELRAALLLQLAMIERVQGLQAHRSHLAAAVAIAREHRLGRLLTIAGQLLNLSPDHITHPQASETLEAANASLDADDHENLAIVRAHLSWTSPNNRSARRVAELVAQAQAFAARSGSVYARAACNDARLFFSAGPGSLDRAEAIAQEIEQECALHPEIATHARRNLVARFRLLRAMQEGDRLALTRAIALRAGLLPVLRNAELSWHHERMLLIKAMNEGAFAQVKAKLIALREQAQRLDLHASKMLWSLDYGVFIAKTGDVSGYAPRVRASLKSSDYEFATTQAAKLRTMVEFGLLEEAAAAIAQVDIASLHADDIPNDGDYLSVLCHLAAGAAATRSLAHCQVLLPLLSPHAQLYAASLSFHCQGSVATHLGLLYEALGDCELAREQLARGLERERAFGLMPCAANTGLRLAKLLLRSAGEHDEALALLVHVEAEAVRMGMRGLEQAASALIAATQSGLQRTASQR